jgi:voltage-gated potassium channel
MMRSMSTPTPAAAAVPAQKDSNAYQMFIFVLTVLSLLIMVGLVMPRVNEPTKLLLNVYDNIICVIFLFDFAMRLRRAPHKRDYLIGERGWLDLLGSIPSFGLIADGGKYASLFRLARLSRLARITRLLRGQSKKEIVADVVENRGQYAVYITLIAAMVVLVLASVFVLQFEATSTDANISSGGDALWWAWVTITTVGYGDYFPVTMGGRIVGFFVMLTGIGIIGALASIFASLLVSPSKETPPPTSDAAAQELRAMRTELADLRRELAQREKGSP